MTVIDILFRVDSICKKYDKYDIEKQRELNANGPGDDAFARLYAAVEHDIEAALMVRIEFSFFLFLFKLLEFCFDLRFYLFIYKMLNFAESRFGFYGEE